MAGQSNRFLVFGYFGGWNSGDEAILQSVAELLRRTQGEDSSREVDIAMVCTRERPSYQTTYERDGLQVITGRSLAKLWNALSDRDLIIGGGQMITGDRSYRGLLFLWLLVTMARLRRKNATMVGVGVEGVHRRIAKFLCRRIVRGCRIVGCRDLYSKSMLESAGCRSDRLKLTADVVLSGVLSEMHPVSRDGQASKPHIALGVHHSPLRQYADVDETRDLAIALADAFPDHQIVLVSNDARDAFDAGLLRLIAEQIDDQRIDFQHFDALEPILDVYGTADCVVSVRMHPLIMGRIYGRPVVGIERSNKVRELATRLGFDRFDPDAMEHADLIRMVRKAVEHPTPSRVSAAIRLAAQENFTTLL